MTLYIITTVTLLSLLILQHFKHKRQLKKAELQHKKELIDFEVDGLLEGIEIGQELSEVIRKIKHREDCKKSRAKIKEQKKEQKKKIIEDTTVVRSEELKRVNPTFKKEQLYIKFLEGSKKSLERAVKEAEILGYKKWDDLSALRFEGEGILVLNKQGEYYTTLGAQALEDLGYKEHKIKRNKTKILTQEEWDRAEAFEI